MKKRFFPAMLLATTLGMIGCADKDIDDVGNNGIEDSGKYAYINAAISFPSSGFTRSATDNYPNPDGDGDGPGSTNSNADSDYENAYPDESEVRSMILVIANENDEYLTHSVVPTITPSSDYDNPAYTMNSKIPYDVLEKAYKKDGILGKTQKAENDPIKVKLYAYCNYTSDILNSFEKYAEDLKESVEGVTPTDWLNWYGTVEEAAAAAGKTKPAITNTIWAKRSFLMTNYTTYQTDRFPSKIEGWEEFSNQSNPLDLTAVKTTNDNSGETNRIPLKVERVAARIDFKDGSGNKNTYPLITNVKVVEEKNGTKTEEVQEKNYFSVQLTRMALVNMSKKYYYLRRVSNNGLGADKDYPTTNSNKWEVGGYEYYNKTTGDHNYVVDVDAKEKQIEKGIVPGEESAGKHFNFCLYSNTANVNGNYDYNRAAWYADNIDDVLKGKNDQWNAEPDKGSYHIWRYVTENTIPQGTDEEHPEAQQKTIQSTGIIFKGAIIAGSDFTQEAAGELSYLSENVRKALNVAAGKEEDEKGQVIDKEKYAYPILYSFNNILYAGIIELVENAFNDGENGPLYQAVNKVLTKNWKLEGNKYVFAAGEGTEGDDALTVRTCYGILHSDMEEFSDFASKSVDFNVGENASEVEKKTAKETEEKFCKLVPAEKITVYEATNEEDGAGMGYYCYYFYWNRHNDNSKSGKMGPMEFATVRNNVYKLSVSKISQLGHPRDTEHDPDPVDPEDPDEDPTNYIKVDVEVLPWVVRENNITF